VLRGEDSVRCSQGATRAQRAAGGGGGGGSRITTGEDSGRGGRFCQAEAELTSNRGLVLRREGQRGWRGGVAGLPKESGGFRKKKRKATESKAAGANAEEAFRDELRRQKKTHHDLTINDSYISL
jgi:hypothetical protein